MSCRALKSAVSRCRRRHRRSVKNAMKELGCRPTETTVCTSRTKVRVGRRIVQIDLATKADGWTRTRYDFYREPTKKETQPELIQCERYYQTVPAEVEGNGVILNQDFERTQRGTGLATESYTVDRWKLGPPASGR